MYDEQALPDEGELQHTYRASRGAVRAALELLRDEGLVERMRGAGTFVAARKTMHRADGLHGLDRPPGAVVHEVLLRQVVPAHGVLVDILRVPPASPVLRLDRRTRVGTEHVALWTSYLRLPLAEPLADPAADLAGDFYDAVERLLGRRLGPSEMTTEAVLADGLVARSLHIPVGAPVLRLERVLLLHDGEPLEFGVGRFRGDRLTLEHSPPAPARRRLISPARPAPCAAR